MRIAGEPHGGVLQQITSLSQAGLGKTSGTIRLGSESNDQLFATGTHPDRNGYPSYISRDSPCVTAGRPPAGGAVVVLRGIQQRAWITCVVRNR